MDTMAGCAQIKWGPDIVVMHILAVIVGFISLLNFVVDIVCKGPSRMFYSENRDSRPDVLTNSSFGSHNFVLLRNTRVTLHCVINGPPDKPLMLLVHGFPEFWYSWRHQLKAFSDDYRVVAFDMRGYGDSSKPSSTYDYTLDKLTEDVDQLITELGYKKCILVAHDWGAIVAWTYAALHPSRVDKLIISNCPHPIGGELYMKSGSLSQLRKSWYVFLFQLPVFPELFMRADDLRFVEYLFCGAKTGAKQGTFTNQDIEAFKYTFSRFDDLRRPIDYYRAMVRYYEPQVIAAQHGKIAVPTLLIWGSNDGALNKEMAEWSRPFVEQCTVHYIEGASHWVQQEQPEQFNLLMRQFLDHGF